MKVPAGWWSFSEFAARREPEAVEALLLLGAESALPELRQRYAREDEDVRCATLAALPEFDPAGEVAWLGTGGGARDINKACQHLALRRMRRARQAGRPRRGPTTPGARSAPSCGSVSGSARRSGSGG